MFKLFLILCVALVLEAVGVVILTQGIRQIGELQQFSLAEIARLITRGACNGRIWVGMMMEAVFFGLLLVMLRSWDVSLIWPLTSLGFVLTTLAAKFIRHEEVNLIRWSGVLLIVAGAMLVGFSEVAKKRPRPSAAPEPVLNKG